MPLWQSDPLLGNGHMEWRSEVRPERLPEARVVPPSALLGSASGTAEYVAGSVHRIASPIREQPEFITTSVRAASPMRESINREVRVLPPATVRMASPVRESLSLNMCASPVTTQYISMAKSTAPRSEMMEVSRVKLMEEAPIVNIKRGGDEGGADVVRMPYLEKRLQEMQDLFSVQVGALEAKISAVDAKMVKVMELLEEMGTTCGNNANRLSKVEAELVGQIPSTDGADLWLKERNDVYIALESLEQSCLATRDQVNALTAASPRGGIDADGVRSDLQEQLSQLFTDMETQWRNFVSATENRLAMGEEARTVLTTMTKKNTDELEQLRSVLGHRPSGDDSAAVAVMQRELFAVQQELRAFERLSQAEVIALARAEIEPLQSLAQELRTLEAITQREAIEPVQALGRELRAFERLSQSEVVALARAEIEPLLSLSRELRALESITQKEAIEPIQALAREVRLLERSDKMSPAEVAAIVRVEVEPLAQELRAFERLSQAEVIAIARAEIEPLQVLARELRALESQLQTMKSELRALESQPRGGGDSSIEVSALRRDIRALEQEIRAFERLTQEEVIALARAELGPLQSLKKELHELETVTRLDAIDPVKSLKTDLRGLTDRVDKLRSAGGADDIEELRRVVGDLAEVSRLQGEQIESLSGGSLKPQVTQQLHLTEDLSALKQKEAHASSPPGSG
eukprot:CAMPEP_0178436134 /NCGR_PEP_ID=MMETSP0689_2-20121128/34284_1 /TAXON_ID=160604 /ORGANISM="Amphidinium massartii, Strain CS-259" /LENGTH=693 /DNA_ID=CAMNT_0020058223 /DNA_START=30 /DNA_END=2107 /DNA_ORIENTATION=+